MFRAVVFTVVDCGFAPRCAREDADGGEVRLQKIERLIENCKFGIHDLSNMELDAVTHLPRFNMPLELGLFLGAKRFGQGPQKQKRLLILDSERYRYREAISDISGQDIDAHGGSADAAITRVRDWLKTVSKRRSIPGAPHVISRYNTYEQDYPEICRQLRYDPVNPPFNDLLETMSEWQKLNVDGD
ncbi:MAG: hypothetical protein AAFQ21_06040 [Pseudomonadota bacterium]